MSVYGYCEYCRGDLFIVREPKQVFRVCRNCGGCDGPGNVNLRSPVFANNPQGVTADEEKQSPHLEVALSGR